MIKLSVIVPIYNAKDFIPDLIHTFEKQDTREFKVIFVNDASSDNSLQLMNELLERSTFAYDIIDLTDNGGPGNARNIGVSKCNTEYVCFVDADDNISSSFFSLLLDKAEKTNADIVFSDVKKVYDDGHTTNHINIDNYIKTKDSKDAACVFDCAPWGKIFKANIWEKNDLSFPLDIRAEDLAVIPALIYYSNKIQVVKQAIYYYRQTIVSRSRSGGQYYADVYKSFSRLKDTVDCFDIIECRAAVHIAYGVVMNTILCGASKDVTMKYISFVRTVYPHAYRNKLLAFLPWQKRLFIYNTYKGRYWIAKLMVKLGK